MFLVVLTDESGLFHAGSAVFPLKYQAKDFCKTHSG